jgi:hypothetical protein
VIVALVLAAAVRLTVPSASADTLDGALLCTGSRPTADLDSLWLWMQVRHNPRPKLVASMRVRGMEGREVVLDVPTDSVATVWAVTSDTAGNRSCPAYGIVNATLDTPRGWPKTPPAPPPAPEWYDLAGRRLHQRPTMPGVYFERIGGSWSRIIVLR